LALLSATPASACHDKNEEGPALYVLAPFRSPLWRAVALIPGYELSASPAQADAIILQGPLGAAGRADITAAVQAGAGLVHFVDSPDRPAMPPVSLAPVRALRTPVRPPWAGRRATPLDPAVAGIDWGSAPRVSPYRNLPAAPDQVLVRYRETGQPALVRVAERTWLLGPSLADGDNRDLVEWPYFNYVVYHLVLRAAGRQPLSFADFPAAPVPHTPHKRAIALLAAAMCTATFTTFGLVRRYSRRHPEVLAAITADRDVRGELSIRHWEHVGFHRPLAGFLVLLSLGLLLFVPFMIYQVAVLPALLSPQALGQWGLVFNFFNVFWILFDMGTSLAFVKFFSELRVHRPSEGLKFCQLYVWWQALTGTLQLSAVAILAALVVPTTAYAIVSWYIVIHALVQFPGFLRVFQYAHRAWQRSDYDQVLNLLAQPAPGGTGPGMVGVLLIIIQSVSVVAVGAAFRGHPVYGSGMGGVFGLGLGLYLTEWSIFVAGMWLYRRMGLSSSVLFLAHFDRNTLTRALRFGWLITASGVAGALGWTVQVILMQRHLVNYAEIQGNWDRAFGLVLAYGGGAALYQGLMPAISEAFGHGRLELTRYYISQGFKYGGWFSGFIASALLAVADRFILGAAGADWSRAAQLVSPLVVMGIFQIPAWFSDSLQQGTGRTWLLPLMLGFEQLVRVVLLVALMPALQIWALAVAWTVALPARVALAWLLNARLIIQPRIYWWQTLVAPLLAGGANYALLRWLAGLVWRNDLPTSLAIFLLATLGSFPWYCFCAGLFGGWDNRGLGELRRAGRLSRVAKPVAQLIYAASCLGARIGPLHGRYPIGLYQAASREARWLTARKVRL
jgi:O-antigen/teichoic acid export membrane protein